MADVLFGVTESVATAMEIVSAEVQSYLIQESILLPTITNFSQYAIKGAKTVEIPRAGGFTVGDKAENTIASASTITYATDQIALSKHKYVQMLVEDIANYQATPDVTQNMLIRAAKDMALQIDVDIIAQLMLASAAAPDHQIVFIDTVNDVIAKGDFLAARKLLRTQNVSVQETNILVGPEKEAEMLALADFIDASKFGSAEPIQNGVIGKIYGMKVLVHSSVTDYMLVYHPSAVGFASQWMGRYQVEKDLSMLSIRHGIDSLYGVKVLDSGKRQVLVDSTN